MPFWHVRSARMEAYSMDLRERVIADCDAGSGTRATAKRYRVSPAWVRRLKQHRRERGDIVPRTGGGSRGRKVDRGRLAELAREQPDATPVGLRDRLGAPVPAWAVGEALRELGLSYKKSRSAPPSRTGPTSPTAARRGA